MTTNGFTAHPEDWESGDSGSIPRSATDSRLTFGKTILTSLILNFPFCKAGLALAYLTAFYMAQCTLNALSS